MLKIVITGSNGLLGQSLVNLLLEYKGKYQVIGLSRGINRSGRNDFSYHSIELTNFDNLKSILKDIVPDVIVNTAAMTQVDICEDEKETCDLINVGLVKALRDYSVKNNCHLIHISTDFIFDGEKGFYKENDIPNPLSYYGASKLKSEELLINSNVDFTILRTILVFGKVYDMCRTNIVLWVKEMLEKGQEITIVNDQFRMPTYADDLALACQLSIDKKALGIFNVSSNTLLSVYEIALQVADVFDLNKELIKPISSKKLNQKAKRPPKTGFDLSKSFRVLGLPSVSFKESLLKFKDSLN